MTRPEPPCGKKCPYRKAGCHSLCDRYQTYLFQNEMYKEERQRKQRIDGALADLKDHCVRSVTHGAVRRGLIKR